MKGSSLILYFKQVSEPQKHSNYLEVATSFKMTNWRKSGARLSRSRSGKYNSTSYNTYTVGSFILQPLIIIVAVLPILTRLTEDKDESEILSRFW
jgi:hypothetical protein